MKHTLTFLTALLLAPPAALHAADSSKPNIVILYADDLGYGDVQCYNPERGKIHTPHLDKLAAQGMRFTDGHSSSGVCSPSRYTLLTGRYHWRTRLQAGIVPLWGAPLIAPDRVTLGTLAKQHGYRTACIGKWHLGWDWPIPEDRAALFKEKPKGAATAAEANRVVWREVFSQPIGGGPTTRGFDSYFGTDVPNHLPFCFIQNDRTVGIPSDFLDADLLKNNQASIQCPALKGWTLEPILPALGDRAVRFIADSATNKTPFLLYLPFTAPHTPLAVNEEWKGKSGLNPYADFVMETDAVVGRVLDALEKSGVAENTMVIFTADNGCAPYIGVSDLEKRGHCPSGPLRGYKADAWEGGHRVPFIVRWPGKVKPGSTCDQLVQQADLIATFADVFETKLPDHVGEDSFSLLPLLKGEDRPIRETAVNCSIGGVPSVRQGKWKYIAAPGSGGWGKGGDQSQPVQLYDLANDIAETKNLAATMPEKVAEMQTLLEKLITDGRSTPGAKQPNDVAVKRHLVQATSNAQAILADPGNVHFSAEGSAQLAGQVVAHVAKALPIPKNAVPSKSALFIGDAVGAQYAETLRDLLMARISVEFHAAPAGGKAEADAFLAQLPALVAKHDLVLYSGGLEAARINPHTGKPALSTAQFRQFLDGFGKSGSDRQTRAF